MVSYFGYTFAVDTLINSSLIIESAKPEGGGKKKEKKKDLQLTQAST